MINVHVRLCLKRSTLTIDRGSMTYFHRNWFGRRRWRCSWFFTGFWRDWFVGENTRRIMFDWFDNFITREGERTRKFFVRRRIECLLRWLNINSWIGIDTKTTVITILIGFYCCYRYRFFRFNTLTIWWWWSKRIFRWCTLMFIFGCSRKIFSLNFLEGKIHRRQEIVFRCKWDFSEFRWRLKIESMGIRGELKTW